MKDREGIVLTVTPNPALDLGGVVAALIPNEKAYVTDETRSPGGNGINVARIIHRLGVPTIATGFLGGSTGGELQDLLDQEHVKASFVKIQGTTRISVTVSNKANCQQTRLSFAGPRVTGREIKKLQSLILAQPHLRILMLGGSLPPGYSSQDILKILKAAKKRNLPVIVDCPGTILKKIISGGPFLIKPNLDEFQSLVGNPVTKRAEVLKLAQGFLRRVPYICVSSVEGGALLVTRHGAYFGRIPKVKVRSSVGAGDSMVGAMAVQIYLGQSDGAELLRWGLAASAASLSVAGSASGSAQEIRRLHKLTKVIKIN